MSERSGIEIDYCPTCRGVWLDRGELDKIIDRSLASALAPAPAADAPPGRSVRVTGTSSPTSSPTARSKESWLSELSTDQAAPADVVDGGRAGRPTPPERVAW